MKNFSSRIGIKLMFFILGYLLILDSAIAQDPLKDIRVSGGSVNFIFNSYSKYDNGIELDSWTRLTLRYKYTGQNGWELYVRAGSNELQYDGSSANNIDISTLELIPVISSSDDPNPSLGPLPIVLSNTNVLVASGDGGDPNLVTTELVISYKIGVPPNIDMINKVEGYYYVDLIYTLVEK